MHFSWITDIYVTKENVFKIMRGGRARWKIGNDTYNTLNTLKTQGYQFEYNYGQGENNLPDVFTTLMMLAFLVDQTQHFACPLFQAVWEKFGSKKDFYE